MISIEIMLLAALGINASIIYIMYRYFNDIIDDAFNDLNNRFGYNTDQINRVEQELNKFEKTIEYASPQHKVEKEGDLIIGQNNINYKFMNDINKIKDRLNTLEQSRSKKKNENNTTRKTTSN